MSHQRNSSISIALGELVYGAHRLKERTAILTQKIEDALLPDLLILSFDAAAARQYGEIRTKPEWLGTS